MKKRSCKRCGTALSEEARFCTTCGLTADNAGTASVSALETRRLSDETENLESAGGTPSPYETEEMPQSKIAEGIAAKEAPPQPAERMEREQAAKQVVAEPSTAGVAASASHPQTRQAKQASGGRKGLLLAAALGVVALAAGAFFFVNSRGSSETQATNQPAAQTPAQPAAQPSVSASDQSQPETEPQTSPTPGELKSLAASGADAGSKSPHTRGETKSAQAASQEKNAADGTGAAAHNLNQGIAHLGAGRYQDALQEFEYVKTLDPGNKNVYYLIGQTYHKMGQLERALEAYRQCTSGDYASIAQNHVRTLEKKLGKTY